MIDLKDENIQSAICELIKDCHGNAVEKKWWEPGPTFAEGLMLVVSELSEALEAYRSGSELKMIEIRDDFLGEVKNKPEGIPVELADAMIRIFDLAGGFDIPLAEAITLKMKYNRTRSIRHGGKKL